VVCYYKKAGKVYRLDVLFNDYQLRDYLRMSFPLDHATIGLSIELFKLASSDQIYKLDVRMGESKPKTKVSVYISLFKSCFSQISRIVRIVGL